MFCCAYFGSETPRNHIIGATSAYFPVCANRAHRDGSDEGDGSGQKYLKNRHHETGLTNHPVVGEKGLRSIGRSKRLLTIGLDWLTILQIRKSKVKDNGLSKTVLDMHSKSELPIRMNISTPHMFNEVRN